MLKKYILASNNEIDVDDKDHYMNKKLKMSGDLLADLIRLNLKVLIGDSVEIVLDPYGGKGRIVKRL